MTQPAPLTSPTKPPSILTLSSAAMINRLIVGTVLVNLFVLAFGGLSIYQSRLLTEQHLAITTQNLARVINENIDGDIDKIDVALLSVQDEVRRQMAGGGLDAQRLNAFMADHQDHQPAILSLRATDVQGVARYGRGVPAVGAPKNADREYFIRARDESASALIVTKPVFTRTDKKWAIVLARRLNQPDGTFAGVVYANVALAHLSRLFAEINVGPHGVIVLRDRDLGAGAHRGSPGVQTVAGGLSGRAGSITGAESASGRTPDLANPRPGSPRSADGRSPRKIG